MRNKFQCVSKQQHLNTQQYFENALLHSMHIRFKLAKQIVVYHMIT